MCPCGCTTKHIHPPTTMLTPPMHQDPASVISHLSIRPCRYQGPQSPQAAVLLPGQLGILPATSLPAVTTYTSIVKRLMKSMLCCCNKQEKWMKQLVFTWCIRSCKCKQMNFLFYWFWIHQQKGLPIYGKALPVQRFDPLNFLKSQHIHWHNNDQISTHSLTQQWSNLNTIHWHNNDQISTHSLTQQWYIWDLINPWTNFLKKKGSRLTMSNYMSSHLPWEQNHLLILETKLWTTTARE
jgi:hypothetical protein